MLLHVRDTLIHNMKTTIITICWNSAKRIQRCVESVLAQTSLPSQYIFVDGGSTDGTIEIIQTLISKLEERKIDASLIAQQRIDGQAGIPSAWNQGIANAHGDIVALLNSDDFYETDTIESIENTFESSENTDLIAGPIRLVDTQQNKVGEIHPKCLWLSEFLMPLPHPACFIRKRLYDRIGLYSTKYKISADYDFIWRCRNAKAEVAYLNKILVNMEVGGLANSSRKLARNETRDIALEHSHIPFLPWIPWAIRSILGK